MQDLTLEVGGVDDVVLDDPERAHSGGREVEGGRRAQSTGTDQQDAGRLELSLAGLADLGKGEVSRVAEELVANERRRLGTMVVGHRQLAPPGAPHGSWLAFLLQAFQHRAPDRHARTASGEGPGVRDVPTAMLPRFSSVPGSVSRQQHGSALGRYLERRRVELQPCDKLGRSSGALEGIGQLESHGVELAGNHVSGTVRPDLTKA